MSGVLQWVLDAVGWAPDIPMETLKQRWAAPPSKFVELDGMQVHVRDEGASSDPVPLVLIHGTGNSLHTWAGFTAGMATNRRMISFDRPGFGLTGPNPTDDYSMEYYADFTLRLLDVLHVKRFVCIGNSSGGRVAWHVALTAPERVDSLVLLAAAGYPRMTPLPFAFRLMMSPAMTIMIERILPRSRVANGVRNSYGDPAKVTDAVVDRCYDITRRAGNRRALGETLRQAQALDDFSSIARISVPTLILWGDLDRIVPPADAEKFAADVKGSRVVMLKGVGHLPQEEAPALTAQHVEEFLAANKPIKL